MKHGERDVEWLISIQCIHLSAFWNYVRTETKALTILSISKLKGPFNITFIQQTMTIFIWTRFDFGEGIGFIFTYLSKGVHTTQLMETEIYMQWSSTTWAIEVICLANIDNSDS